MSIQELLDKANGVEPLPPKPASNLSDRLRALIDAEKQKPLKTVPFEIELGGAWVEVVIIQVRGLDWSALTGHEPRPGHAMDAKLQCNSDQLLEGWPTASVTVDGEHPSREQWEQILRLIDAPWRADIAATIHWIHWAEPMTRLKRLQIEREEKKHG